MDLPKRKLLRLKNYDYSKNGAFFITICTHNHEHLFGKIDDGNLILNNAGKIVYNKFSEITAYYPHVFIDKFIIMPNHIHAILLIQCNVTSKGLLPLITLSDYICRFKTLTTKLYIDGVKNGVYPPFDKKIWQKSYHDHIIRDEEEYQIIWEYIDTNPLKWYEDKYFV